MIPIILITGFLGSGKTTFLNWLLEHHPDLKISVILNEFGNTQLESQFVRYHQNNIVELANGCMCCVAKSDIPRVLRYILENSPQTEYILIEASGLSDPDPVREALQSPPINQHAYLENTICIVDAINFEQMKTQNSIVTSQIADADLVVISKVVEAGPKKVSQIKELLERMTPDVRTLQFDQLLSPEIFLQKTTPTLTKPPHNHQHTHQAYDIITYQSDKLFNLDALSHYLSSLPEKVIRIKGVIRCQSNNQDPFWVRLQRVGAHFSTEITQNHETEVKTSSILIIGRDLDETVLTRQLDSFIWKD